MWTGNKFRRPLSEAPTNRQQVVLPQPNPQPQLAEKFDIGKLTIDERAYIVAALHYQVRNSKCPRRPIWLPVRYHEVDFQHLADWEIALVTDELTGVVITKLYAHIRDDIERPNSRNWDSIGQEKLSYEATVYYITVLSKDSYSEKEISREVLDQSFPLDSSDNECSD